MDGTRLSELEELIETFEESHEYRDEEDWGPGRRMAGGSSYRLWLPRPARPP